MLDVALCIGELHDGPDFGVDHFGGHAVIHQPFIAVVVRNQVFLSSFYQAFFSTGLIGCLHPIKCFLGGVSANVLAGSLLVLHDSHWVCAHLNGAFHRTA